MSAAFKVFRAITSLTLAIIVALYILPISANAQEVIKSFSSNITLMENGSVDVVETITVKAEGKSIRRGIFRDIPTVLRNNDGSIIRSDLTVTSILKDGKTEPYFTDTIEGGTRIYLGEESVFLESGIYTYSIAYTMTRMARSFEDYDELYWNATGNFWSFPIENAVAQVTLPNGANIVDLAAYTGRQGATGTDAKFTRTSENTAVFRATRSFGAREGMSISVSFEKGVLSEPSSLQKVLYFISDRRNILFPVFAVFMVMAYYLFAWLSVGRDPQKGVIIPLFKAPKGYSAALVHYIDRMGWKKSGWNAFSAALVSLSVKGLMSIGEDNKKMTLKATDSSNTKLPPGEAVIYNYLRGRGLVVINKSSGKDLNKTKNKFVSKIETENANTYFVNNFTHAGVGLLLSLIAIVSLIFFGFLPFETGVMVLMFSVFALIFLGASSGSIANTSLVSFGILAWFIIMGINIGSGIFDSLSPYNLDMALIAAISIVLINLIFLVLLKAPTIQGRKILDQIDGFKMYLETAEKNRLNFNGEPDFTIERFEEILPFAIALGVEKPWSNRLEGEFSRHAIEQPRGGYHPSWHSGSSFGSKSLVNSVAGISAGLSAAMIASQPSSSSSSGGGGGGSSGGGGGGGGGGGW